MNDTVTLEELEELRSGPKPPKIIDVRRQTDRENDPLTIPGSEWRDPEKAAEWGREYSGSETVVYCARGGSVSRTVLAKLREQGIDAKYIEGGIEAWKQSVKKV